ncbi:nucleotidyltransferase family protein [Sphingomonas sp. HF-S3]|uniref:Nucleotidyltransferase family protein n=1 Tax=Sphingomonas rustica TaxID=3103142 RepID=A0ABV0B5R6_9SPHN
MATCRFWPDPLQAVLLHAVLDEGPTAAGAARDWLGRVAFDTLDAGSQRLLPLLSTRLKQHGIDHPLRARIDGFYRRAWYFNQRFQAQLALIRRLLDDIGVPHLLLKGAALGPDVYGHGALRPADDIDILVRPSDLRIVGITLQDLGWISTGGDPGLFGQSETFRSSIGEIDVHVSPFPEITDDRQVEALWEDSREIEKDGLPAHFLSRHDQLLHTLTHGLRVNEVPPIRWVADAVFCIRAYGQALDWDRFAERAEKLQFALVASRGLGYLNDHFSLPVPETIVRRLARAGDTRQERMEFALTRERVHFPLGLWVVSRRSGLSCGGRLKSITSRYSTAWQTTGRIDFLKRAATRAVLGRARTERRYRDGKPN